VNDLLDVSRITQGKVLVQKEPVDLTEVVDQALQTCEAIVHERGHELSVSLPQTPLLVEADPTRMVQVVCNLLTNAAKYTEPGGRISVTVEREEEREERGMGAASPPPSALPFALPAAVVRVRDNGRGIAPELLPRIFEVFVQAQRTLDRSEGGIGVGLTLVRSLVEMHGGSVEARSEGPGKGSEFIVRLPLLIAGAETQSPRPAPFLDSRAPDDLQLPSRRVLIIEDNEDAADTMAELLRTWGYEATVARTGPEGVEAARGLRPDAVLLDIGLPGMDGYAAARALRQKTGYEGMLIALTGYAREEDQRRAMDAGFDVHLTKPVDPPELRRILQGQSRGA
jgi:CheY-like chemotaxis protein/two-component sensor histidine kinase